MSFDFYLFFFNYLFKNSHDIMAGIFSNYLELFDWIEQGDVAYPRTIEKRYRVDLVGLGPSIACRMDF